MPSENGNKVLEALTSGIGPFSTKEIAELSGLEPKQISCQMGGLKKKGLIESPVRCKYIITEAGRAELNN